ncbi:Dolichyl-diphosphooligosaccharide--protein glycosyltransferase subunit STT3 [Diplonema papillatum]|nr:Dolichyl-diphosphooligosaccharide--protein glycosyltransferase subunit STT3 [Diplonema papillatum]
MSDREKLSTDEEMEQNETQERNETLMRYVALGLIFLIAFSVRLFSVLEYEAIIHEFDPWFNYRTTKKLVDDGIYDFYSWFDVDVWYPLGRIVGGTIYPGLMVTSMIFSKILHFFNFPVDTRIICVFLAPVFSGVTAMVAYWFTAEIWNVQAALLAAFFMALVPSYMSRSVAGSYDNEGVAIFALVAVFATFVKTVKTGSLMWCCVCVLSYYYMVNAWGGYIFIANLLPLYVAVMLLVGKYSLRLHVAYSAFYVLGTLMSMQIHFVGFQAVQTGEHMAAAAVFFFLQAYGFVNFVRQHLTPAMFASIVWSLVIGLGSIAGLAASVGVATGYIAPWTGRFWTLLDPTYAKTNIPIIASVSEHQPTTWGTYFFDLHLLAYALPVGVFFCMKKGTDAAIFIVVYGMATVYFSGVMVRLMLVLAPAACILGGIGLSEMLTRFLEACLWPAKTSTSPGDRPKKNRRSDDKDASNEQITFALRWTFLFGLIWVMMTYTMHCTWAGAEAYSSPSIILSMRTHTGQRIIYDDYREAYQWLRTNTARDAKIMSWWDYGYQITGMSNRTVLVDNNTWNNTHIATVGKAMASQEDISYQIMKKMDVEFALVIFGGFAGYSGDDINKFLWMVRIAGTLDSDIQESDYMSRTGNYVMDASGGKAMLNSLMYKLSYYRFAEMKMGENTPEGYDRVRNTEIGVKNIKLEYMEEAFTTEHWILRIYRVKPESNRKPTPVPSKPLVSSFATAPK